MNEPRPQPEKALIDRFGRRHDYLRVSVTDRCNLRCQYCMGPEGVPLLDHSQILSYEEILEIVRAAVSLGIRRIRLTGGEPLVRAGLTWLIQRLHRLPGVEDLSMTTNGILLAGQAKALRRAGLNRVNISLDTLDPEAYREITRGGDLGLALAGIEAALAAGLHPVKINTVLMPGVNENEIPRLLQMASERPLHVRFIEQMPIGALPEGAEGQTPCDRVLEIARWAGFELDPGESPRGNGPAQVFRVRGGRGTVGLIPALSRCFCAECNRLRLTTDGFLKPCLYWQEELPLRPLLGDAAAIRAAFLAAVRDKHERHEMGSYPPESSMRCMSRTGG